MRSTGEGIEIGTGFGDPVFTAPASLSAAVAAVREVLRCDIRGLDDEACLGMFDGLEVLDRLFHAVRFEMLSELDARDLTDRRFGHVTANESGWRHGTDPRRIKRDLKTAKTLRRSLPDLASALAAGAVSVDRVRVLAAGLNDRNSDAITGAQAELLDLTAQQGTFTAFCRDVEQVMRLADVDGAEPPRPRNHASLSRAGDHVSATLDLYGTDGMGLSERLGEEAERLYRQWAHDHGLCADIDIPPRSELLAQAFLNLVEAGTAHRNAGRSEPTSNINIVVDVDEATVSDLFADGVLLPGPGHGPLDWSKKATDLTGARLRHSSHEWDLLTCDPTYTWIIVAADGHPVACRSGERHANRQQRRALTIRDGGCVFPGCEAPAAWCDAHHVQHHEHDGTTETRNLALLCRRHHGVVHRNGWSMTAAVDVAPGEGLYQITSPTGTVLTTCHERGPGRRSGDPPQRRRPDPA